MSKYGNVRCGKYASKKEANIGLSLHALHKNGKILELQEQVPFDLVPGIGKIRSIKYVADFTYFDLDGTFHCIDVKGYRTPVYKLKKKMMFLLLGIEVEEI